MKQKTNNKNYTRGIILLSGGLDCVSSLCYMQQKIDFDLALTFDYGQSAFPFELEASKKIANFYAIKHKVVTLNWLKELCPPTCSSSEVFDLEDEKMSKEHSKKLWIPNRNALFINIATSYADSNFYNADVIVIGANKEEAECFVDNSKDFILSINQTLKYSTNKNIEVFAPFLECTKSEIIKYALENHAPLEHIYSCYVGAKKQCGRCASCKRLIRALKTLDEQTYKRLYKLYFEE